MDAIGEKVEAYVASTTNLASLHEAPIYLAIKNTADGTKTICLVHVLDVLNIPFLRARTVNLRRMEQKNMPRAHSPQTVLVLRRR